jgi:EAL domain-containing protein (putative c-di-GMP-specific phosphodiesterase class I)
MGREMVDEVLDAKGRHMTLAPEPIRLLLVDDDPAILRTYRRALERRGATVTSACNGKEAVGHLEADSFDVIVSDICMPEMTGIEFLEAVRGRDVDVPVILVTGTSSMETAIPAIEYGAFRYLSKPVREQELWDVTLRAASMHKLARIRRAALEIPGLEGKRGSDRATREVRFSFGVSLMWIAFQPIVGWADRRVFGYEALLRSDEPLLKNPAELLEAAERLGRLHELGRTIRAKVATAAEALEHADAKLFVNLHSSDLNDDELYSPDAPLSRIASRVVLEVTERASLDEVKNVAACVKKLKALGFQIAIDDLGAGYAGLTSFTQLEPEIAKLDMSLVRGVDLDPRRQSIIRSVKKLCDDLGVLVVAEGVETAAERDMLAKLECDLLQGYLFAKPQRGFPRPQW